MTATISWGNRKSIINDAEKMLRLMDDSPYEFVMNFTESDLPKTHGKAIHRTFNEEDFHYFLQSLQRIYRDFGSISTLMTPREGEEDFYHALERFRTAFFSENPKHRSGKHVSSTYKNSAAKRLMMYLRWMVRKDKKGVDFGIWDYLGAQKLSVPLDVHTANISRKLGLIRRTQNDWKTVREMDIVLRKFNPEDPAKYDFALFGLGVSGDF